MVTKTVSAILAGMTALSLGVVVGGPEEVMAQSRDRGERARPTPPPRGGTRPAPPPRDPGSARPPRDTRPVPPPRDPGSARPPRDPRPPVVRPPVVRPPVSRDFVRDRIRRDREHRVADIRRTRERISFDRSDWHVRRPIVIHRDYGYIRAPHVWQSRYDRWRVHVARPIVPIFTRPVRWYQPVYDQFQSIARVEEVATNIENLTREVYEVMDGVIHTNPNREYALRLMRVLGDLIDASENFTDTVYDREDYQETLYDLFYLEEKVDLAVRTLDGYSREYLVREEMNAIKYYVDELLWQYGQWD